MSWPAFSPYFVTIPLGIFMFLYLIHELRLKRKNSIEFFLDMDALKAAHPISETFKPGNEIHALFLTGEGVFAENSNYIKCVKRLILPAPNRDNLERLENMFGEDYNSQIIKYARMAHRNDKNSFRFYKEFLGISLLFCNPNSSDGWVQVGIILPRAEASERQHFRLSKAMDEAAFNSLYKTFEYIWSEEESEERAMIEAYNSDKQGAQ